MQFIFLNYAHINVITSNNKRFVTQDINVINVCETCVNCVNLYLLKNKKFAYSGCLIQGLKHGYELAGTIKTGCLMSYPGLSYRGFYNATNIGFSAGT